MARYLRGKGTPQEVVVGFAGRVSRIARVHQYGLKDRAEREAPTIHYAQREILGLATKDLTVLRDFISDRITID